MDNKTREKIDTWLKDSIELRDILRKTEIDTILTISKVLIKTLKQGGKIILFGNGGSAADAQHIAAEFVGRFRRERKALPAISLTTDTSVLTAIANDYDFRDVFTRQVQALAQKKDIAWGISTSGNSNNVFEALVIARHLGLTTISLTGKDGGKISRIVDYNINIPSNNTAHIQEAHITVGHILCELVEEALFE